VFLVRERNTFVATSRAADTGHPASFAVSVILGTTCSCRAFLPAIRVIVPVASLPQSWSIFGPSAAIRFFGGAPRRAIAR
jgi:hypothetical protein